jgi:hypothetical protein
MGGEPLAARRPRLIRSPAASQDKAADVNGFFLDNPAEITRTSTAYGAHW